MLLIQDTTDGGLTFEAVIRNLPHDAGAIVVYVLMLAFIGFIWYGSRKPPAIDEARDETGD
ncbi:MAG TPA: hypothetical protein VFU06_16260 [Longimicrobiales bacterium]|nr:hypothetical protein [Longimicrobiales bacterium]